MLVSTVGPGRVSLTAADACLQLRAITFVVNVVIDFMGIIFIIINGTGGICVFLNVEAILSVVTSFLLVPGFNMCNITVSGVVMGAVLTITSF